MEFLNRIGYGHIPFTKKSLVDRLCIDKIHNYFIGISLKTDIRAKNRNVRRCLTGDQSRCNPNRIIRQSVQQGSLRNLVAIIAQTIVKSTMYLHGRRFKGDIAIARLLLCVSLFKLQRLKFRTGRQHRYYEHTAYYS